MDQGDEELEEQEPTRRLLARLPDENVSERETAKMPYQQADADVHPSPSFALRRVIQSEVMGERYQLHAPIGRGGMATIYRGMDTGMNRVVAVKVLHDAFNSDEKFVRRFQLEAKAASSLQHPNIVQVYDYGLTDDNYYIVMELVEGTNLRRYLRSRGVLDVNRTVIIAHDVALGLAAAHRRGIVHRDVKPQNILVGRDGSIKLTDFGIASVYRDMNANRLTTTGMTLGTVQYYAPEQAQGEIVSPAADVYALGIVMYEMLTGRTPFDGDSPVTVATKHIQDAPIPPSQLNPSIPAALEEIILRCLEKVPELRFRDGSQLARALEKPGEFQPGTVRSSSEAQRGERNSRFAMSMAILIPLAVLLLLGFSAYLAAELGFIHLSSITGSKPTPTDVALQIPVPKLLGLDYQAASALATEAGFTLQVPDGNKSGVIISQNPAPPALAAKGTTILVKFGPGPQATTTVPPLLVGNTLSAAEQLLATAGLRWSIKSAGNDPSKAANIVSKVTPSSGSPILAGGIVTLSVVNYTDGSP